MTTAYERHLIVFYLANAAARLHYRDRAAGALIEWVMDREGGPAFASRRLLSRLDRANIDPDERLSGSEWRHFQRALRDECAAAAALGRDDRPQSNGRRHPGTYAALPDAADHRSDDRRGSTPFDPVRETCHPRSQGLDGSCPARRFRQHSPRWAFRWRSAGELGARFRRAGWRRDDRRPAAATGYRPWQCRPRREPFAAGRRACERAPMVVCGRVWTPPLMQAFSSDGWGMRSVAVVCPASGVRRVVCRGPVWRYADRVQIGLPCLSARRPWLVFPIPSRRPFALTLSSVLPASPTASRPSPPAQAAAGGR